LKEFITDILKDGRIEWQRHALQRMLERDISRNDVKQVLLEGEIIEEYSKDQPFPSFLIPGFLEENKPLHVVAALDKKDGWCYIITAYQPDASRFKDNYKTRIQ